VKLNSQTYHLSYPESCQYVVRWYNNPQTAGATASLARPLERKL